ncbi:DUF1284 domain-containing protein [bacterium]|nr:DUF1284 domain-containing protein [bacterium]
MNIRGHHLFCTYCFYGSGKKKAEDFFGVENAIPELLIKLRQNPDIEICVKTDLDDICEICPLRRPDGCGRSFDAAAQNKKLSNWDRALLDTLELKEGDSINARLLEICIREKVPDISKFCSNCSSASPSGWKEYQIGIRKGFWPDEL